MASKQPPKTFVPDLEQLDRLYKKLRGLISELGMRVRLMESQPPPSKMAEHAQRIAETSAEIEQLLQKLRLPHQKR